MNTSIKTSIQRLLLSSGFIVFALGYFAVSPTAQGVVPAPDGGYPGGNTAEGQSALLNLTTGTYNTALGLFSLLSDGAGNFNTGVGAGTLLSNRANQNTATGAGALLGNTTGDFNTADGAFALFNNTTGFNNTANGAGALQSNSDGTYNTATGVHALFNNTHGFGNTAYGVNALFNNIDASSNTAVGTSALFSNTTGVHNTGIGTSALHDNIAGTDNTAIGFNVLTVNTGTGNTAIGSGALSANTTGSFNVAINGGHNLTDGIFNIDIANDGVAGESNTTRIGILQNRCFISGIRDVTTGVPDAISVVIDSAGQLGTVSSSRRFKDDIKSMNQASEGVLFLRPVTFHYKSDHTARPQFGLIAEEVAKVNPDLVVRDGEGEIYTVRYEAVNAMLLNEFLKEHKEVEEQQATIRQLKSNAATQAATITELKKDIGSLSGQLKDQGAQIRRVSAQIEMSPAASKVATH
jgi:hypothetical protein